MEPGFLISLICIAATIALGLSLTFYNAKKLEETREERMEIYRRRKRAKNAALAQFLGLPPPN